MSKIKILTVSNTAWSNDNSFGITFSSFFDGMPDIEVANIYCNVGKTDASCVSRSYQITEEKLLKTSKSNSKVVDKARVSVRKNRLQLAMWARDIVWKFGNWKTPELEKFITDFAPDVIFTPVYYKFHTNRILRYAQKLTGAPMLCYISDDIYSMKQFSLSPLYWIDRLMKRASIRKTLKNCDCIYVVCEEQRKEYEKAFGKKCKILLRPFNADVKNVENTNNDDEVKRFVYTGNLGADRYKTLALAGERIAASGGVLEIYSATPLTKKMEAALNIKGVEFKGCAAADAACAARRRAHILVHVEGFSRKAFGKARFSVSTKLPDYLASGKTILAIGPEGIASIDYLKSNCCAIIADSKEKITKAVLSCVSILENQENLYVKNAQNCIKRDFNKETIQKELMEDLARIMNDKGGLSE